MTRKVRDMCSALCTKGFREEDKDHKVFWLIVDGKKSTVRTFFSHGQSEYGVQLLACVRKQMRLTSKEFDDFMDCPMNQAQYIEKLKALGVIVTEKPQPIKGLPQKPRKKR